MKQVDRQEWKTTYQKSKLRYEPKDGVIQWAYCVDGVLQKCEDHL
jgi:hypothetical protein